MRILILGGTKFVGPHLVESALQQGHEITTFTRGKQPSRPMAGIEMLFGDRNTDLRSLAGRSWDAVIDTCGYTPNSVSSSAHFFSERAELYVFVSSISVYTNFSVFGINESAPVAHLTPEQLERAEAVDTSGPISAVSYGDLYGGLKALSEKAAEAAMPGRVLVVRPGLIVGPGDNTDRFSYWIARTARGGEVLAPGRPERKLQFIDVRDLTEWMISMVERKQAGIFNANGLPGAFSMSELLAEAKEESGSDASFTWIPDDFLSECDVAPWSEIPLWLPEEAEHQGFMFIDSSKAIENGLTFRPLRAAIRGVLDDTASRNIADFKAGLHPDKEASILRRWHESKHAIA